MRRALIGAVTVLLGLSPLAVTANHAGASTVTTPAIVLPGTPIDGDIPVVGDWNGDGSPTVGVRRGATFYLRNENSTGQADVTFDFGLPSDRPVAGDWDGDGTTTVGVRRGAEFYLRNENSTGQADIVVTFGLATDYPVVGDWDGNGTVTIGVWRPSTHAWYGRNSNTPGPAEWGDFLIDPGLPLVGSWDGGTRLHPGYYSSTDILQPNFRGVNEIDTYVLYYGIPYDFGLVGDWNDDGFDTLGVRRGARFYLTDVPMSPIALHASAQASNVFTYGLPTVVAAGYTDTRAAGGG